jgi:diguanylate cyclase
MADPIVVQHGVIIDTRGVILTLAGPFGGAVAAAIAAASAIAFRLWLGGAGAPVGCITILVGAIVGLLFARRVPLRQGAYSLRQLSALAVFGSLHGFTVLFVLVFIPVPGLAGSLIPLCMLNFAGVVVLGSFLSQKAAGGMPPVSSEKRRLPMRSPDCRTVANSTPLVRHWCKRREAPTEMSPFS